MLIPRYSYLFRANEPFLTAKILFIFTGPTFLLAMQDRNEFTPDTADYVGGLWCARDR